MIMTTVTEGNGRKLRKERDSGVTSHFLGLMVTLRGILDVLDFETADDFIMTLVDTAEPITGI